MQLTVWKPVLVKKEKRKVIPATDDWVEYWNTLPNLISHRTGSDVYKKSAKAVQNLLNGMPKLTWNKEWIERNHIHYQFLTQPWPAVAIEKTMQILSQMGSPGYFPGPVKSFTGMSLANMIYNSWGQTSWMMYARSKGKASLASKHGEEYWISKASPPAKMLLAQLETFNAKIPVGTAEEICRQYNILCRQDALFRHLCPGIESFGRMLGRWLVEQKRPKPGTAIAPSDGWLWKKFLTSMAGFSENA